MINVEYEENNSPNWDTRVGLQSPVVKKHTQKKNSEIPPPHRLQTISGPALIHYNNSLTALSNY